MDSITVLYFAGIADITQLGSETVSLTTLRSTTATDVIHVSDVVDMLIKKYGNDFEKVANTCMFAVDMDYVPRSHPLKPGQEMALIPPVSGG
ncbi:putative molybdopterin converting factor, small subunit [Halteromyces radiatus]|uniref:putative molybdopterin converting factor, small subunit n=1 Tax=Halteromyces radiatus TaxID=101107 RepID=UPI0022210C9C|nr:putative molybdopterin converting factor, small subunit [Halteromyces radiatus]KAI8089112.1 putative molybdopterin converting factor, small subunit [Halteromyces radiatus]